MSFKSRRALVPAAVLALSTFAATVEAQQGLVLPRPSPNATVSQMVGVTEVTIRYSRPGVKGRKVWGELVPYGEVWRTGANENTTIAFSTPVKVDGHELPAGTYGLQTLPTADSWTVIFSKDADQWGAFNYKKEDDALRFEVKPTMAAYTIERMRFTFDDVTDNSAKIVLRWEKLRLEFAVETDTPKLVAEKVKAAVRWQEPYQAANYCIQNDVCLDEAGRWLDASIALQEGFGNLRAKAILLGKKGDAKGAVSYGERALAAAKTAQQPPQPQQVKDLEAMIAEWKKK
jgi:hypothetical protein